MHQHLRESADTLFRRIPPAYPLCLISRIHTGLAAIATVTIYTDRRFRAYPHPTESCSLKT